MLNSVTHVPYFRSLGATISIKFFGNTTYYVLRERRRALLNMKDTQETVLPRRSSVFILLLALLISGCAVSFIGPYDELTDRAITDLQNRTELFITRMRETGGRYSQNRDFYSDARARLASIRLREELYARKLKRDQSDTSTPEVVLKKGQPDPNDPTLRLIELLRGNLDQLEKLHQEGPLTGTAGKVAHQLINTNFQSLLQLELAKKRSSGVSTPSN